MRKQKVFFMIAVLEIVIVSFVVAQSTGKDYLVGTIKPPYTIGFSNAFSGNSYRAQEVAEVKNIADQYKAQGLVKNYIVLDATGNTATQIQQITNLISSGVNVILIDANSDTALNPVIKSAHNAGILVVTVSNTVTSPYAINVSSDQEEYGALCAEWLVKKLNGKGNVLVLNGLAGSPINAARWNGGKKVFNKYPNIKILTTINANWDQATAQAAVSNVLPSFPKIDGIWSQGGAMTLGAIYAFQAAGRRLVPMTAESNNGFLKVWKQLKDKGDKDFDSIAIQEPNFGMIGVQTAIKALQGQNVEKEMILPFEVITADTLDKFVKPDLSDSLWLPTNLSEEQIQALFGVSK
jgi:ribose transport system substrate-binding protein